MSKVESDFRFPQGIDGQLLAKLTLEQKMYRARMSGVANVVLEEGYNLRFITKTRLVFDQEAGQAVEEFLLTMRFLIGVERAFLNVEYQEYYQREFALFLAENKFSDKDRGQAEKAVVDLLKRDPAGCFLLDWWVGQAVWQFRDLGEQEKQARLAGREGAARRYKELYYNIEGKTSFAKT